MDLDEIERVLVDTTNTKLRPAAPVHHLGAAVNLWQ
jgi:hypothetical protein